MERECVLVQVRKCRGSNQLQNVVVQGWPTGLPGLYVTLDYGAALNGLKRYGYTHIKSGFGFHCGGLVNKRVAIKYAKKHLGVIDWTLDKGHVTTQPGAVNAYKQSTRDLKFK